jgi:rhomboid protease GluP
MEQAEPMTQAEEWVKVGHYPSLQQAYDHGLVILAMGKACRVEETETPGAYDLQAEAHPAARIHHELDSYAKESIFSKSTVHHRDEIRTYPAGTWLTMIWALLLIGVFHWQAREASLVNLGASSSVALFRDGEWWRPFTALFLHADVPHLVGNLAGGAIFGTLVSRALGPLMAWTMILICGMIGNVITARAAYPDTFLSIGASTAVFAALGILSGLGASETLRNRPNLPWARIAAPVLAGMVLLGWLGSGGSGTNTDVLGHVCGFGAGLAAGAVMGSVRRIL